MRSVIALSAIPVAIVANGLRVASAGVAAHNFGTAGVEGVFHDLSGWVVFGIAFEGHPDLTRIYMPQDFDGWPMRRDFPLEGHLRFRD